jgi:hypothetical protein
VTTFQPDAKDLYACVRGNYLLQGAVVEATWSYNNTSLDAFATRVTIPDTTPQRWIAFHITRDPNVSWPAGSYAVAVAVNGTVLQRASIEVAASS